MKHFKKLLIFIVIALSLTLVSTSNYAQASTTTVLGAEYLVNERVKDEMLSSGVRYINDTSSSSASLRITTQTDSGLGGTNPLIAGQLYPQKVNVLEVPSTQNVKIIPWALTNNSAWSLATVTNMAKNFELTNPGWRVIAAVNGDFFDIGGRGNLPYQPSGAMLSDGEMFRSTSSGSTVGFITDGGPTSIIGGKPTKSANIMLSLYDEFDQIIETIPVDKINQEPLEGEFSLYYANWKQKTEEDTQQEILPIQVNVAHSTQYIIGNAEKSLANSTTDFYGIGSISEINQDTIITSGQFALVSKNAILNEKLSVNTRLRVQYEYTGAFMNAYSVIGAGATILNGGVAIDSNEIVPPRHPRTIVGKKADGTIVFATIDGRQPQNSMYGATHQEMAAVMLHYGAVEAHNLDGGGSTTMIIRRGNTFEVVNSPSDGGERRDTNGLLVVTYDPSLVIDHMNDTTIQIMQRSFGVKDVEFSNATITINDITKEIVDSRASFDGLTSLTEYTATFTYELTTSSKITIVQGDPFTFTTGRKRPKVVQFDIVGVSNLKYVLDYKVSDSENSKISLILKYGTKEIFLDGPDGRVYVNKTSPTQEIEFSLVVLYNHQGTNTILEEYSIVAKENILEYSAPSIELFEVSNSTNSTVSFDYEIEDVDNVITGIILKRGNSEIGISNTEGTYEVQNVLKGVYYNFQLIVKYSNPITNEILGQISTDVFQYINRKAVPTIQTFALTNETSESVSISYEIIDTDNTVLGVILKYQGNEVGLEGLVGVYNFENILQDVDYDFQISILYKTATADETSTIFDSSILTYRVDGEEADNGFLVYVVLVATGSTVAASGLGVGAYFIIKRRKL